MADNARGYEPERWGGDRIGRVIATLLGQGRRSDHERGRFGKAEVEDGQGSQPGQGAISSCWYMKVNNCCQLGKYMYRVKARKSLKKVRRGPSSRRTA